jgi:hypothetical protein
MYVWDEFRIMTIKALPADAEDFAELLLMSAALADESTVQLRGRQSFSFYRMCKELK